MRQLALFLIGLFFGGGLGFLVAASYGVTLDGHDHSDPAHHAAGKHEGMDHRAHQTHAPLNLPAGPNAPTLGVALTKDAKGGWNLQIVTENFLEAYHVEFSGEAHVALGNIIDIDTYRFNITGRCIEYTAGGGEEEVIPYDVNKEAAFTNTKNAPFHR